MSQLTFYAYLMGSFSLPPSSLQASRGAMQQKRLDSFFKPSGSSSTSSTTLKRKEAPAAAKGKGKAKFGGKKK